MRIIKISTDKKISVHDFPEGSYSDQNRVLKELIGPRCELFEHVMPKRLYTVLGGSNKVRKKEGSCVSMLIDEEGLYHDLEDNMVGSWLYETDKHGHPIVGNILIIDKVKGSDGIDFCGISDSQFDLLYPKLNELVKKARELV